MKQIYKIVNELLALTNKDLEEANVAELEELQSTASMVRERALAEILTRDAALTIEEIRALNLGKPIEAIKLYRDRTGVGLVVAKRVIDRFRDNMRK